MCKINYTKRSSMASARKSKIWPRSIFTQTNSLKKRLSTSEELKNWLKTCSWTPKAKWPMAIKLNWSPWLVRRSKVVRSPRMTPTALTWNSSLNAASRSKTNKGRKSTSAHLRISSVPKMRSVCSKNSNWHATKNRSNQSRVHLDSTPHSSNLQNHWVQCSRNSQRLVVKTRPRVWPPLS